MNKIVLTCFLASSAFFASAQSTEPKELIVDPNEDPEQVVTIEDIVKLQENVTMQQSRSSHFDDVWRRKSFFNISYITSGSLKPKEEYTLGYDAINDNRVPDFKADYGFALQLGNCYNLHKKPIGNTLTFNLDYTYIDLSMVHYKKYADEGYVYDSSIKWQETIDKKTRERQYIPWCLSKYDINYGMNIGPSLTIAPFNYVNSQQLHYMMLNVYYHIGYQVGILWMPNDLEADADGDNKTSYYTDPMKINWQHGLVQSIGFNLTWKSIGIGFESRFDNRTYKSCDPSTFGSESYKFSGKNSRIYLRICY